MIYYSPSTQQITQAQVTKFMGLLAEAHGMPLSSYAELHRFSIRKREEFWSAVWDFCEIVGDKGTTPLAPGKSMIDDTWFPNGKVSFRRSVLKRNDDTPAIVEYAEEQRVCEISFAELQTYVDSITRALLAQGISQGDRVALMLPNGIDAIAFALGVASVGGVVCSVAPEFGEQALQDRLLQVAPKLLVTVQQYTYSGKQFFMGKKIETLATSLATSLARELPKFETVIIPRKSSNEPSHKSGSIVSGITLDAFLKQGDTQFGDQPLPESLYNFNDPLYILFSSGTTGKPKCIVHGIGGTLLQHRKEHRLQLNIQAEDTIMYLTSCGWMMWNWQLSCLAEGATLVCYDGSPFYPEADSIFRLLEREQVSCFGTSAKFIGESLKRIDVFDADWFNSVRQVFSTGSPLLPEHFQGMRDRWGKDMPAISMSGGTDIISCFVLGNPISDIMEGEIQGAGLGLAVEVWNQEGKRVIGEKGELVCVSSFPSMPIGFWGDSENKDRYHNAYFSKFEGVWTHGDYIEETAHGGYVIYGRSDTVLNPGGVRIGTAEIYQALEGFSEINESVCVGFENGNDVEVVLFTVLTAGVTLDDALIKKIKICIKNKTSPRHVPKIVKSVTAIPKTLSGKIAEIAVREAIHGRPVKNKEALANPESLLLFENFDILNQ